MWRTDRVEQGPFRVMAHDIEALNRLFAEAFTERYRRDGLSGVRVPHLNPAVWQFSIDDGGDGAMLWRDGRGDLIAFNMAHRSGAEGWMGPLAVRLDRQGSGMGRRIVMAGVEWLQRQGATVIGLETMPRTIDNIGFYSRLGFTPGPLTVTLQREPLRAQAPTTSVQAVMTSALMQQCRQLSTRIAPGVDFTREIELTLEQGLGDVSLCFTADGTLHGFTLWHTAALAQGRATEELRVLKLVAIDTGVALDLLHHAERHAEFLGLQRMSVRCQMAERALYALLIGDGYRVHWTDLRMTFAGHDEPVRAGVLLSNWEI